MILVIIYTFLAFLLTMISLFSDYDGSFPIVRLALVALIIINDISWVYFSSRPFFEMDPINRFLVLRVYFHCQNER